MPQFAGYFLDGDGNLVVRVTDLALSATVRAAVDSVAEARPKYVNGVPQRRDVVVVPADAR